MSTVDVKKKKPLEIDDDKNKVNVNTDNSIPICDEHKIVQKRHNSVYNLCDKTTCNRLGWYYCCEMSDRFGCTSFIITCNEHVPPGYICAKCDAEVSK